MSLTIHKHKIKDINNTLDNPNDNMVLLIHEVIELLKIRNPHAYYLTSQPDDPSEEFKRNLAYISYPYVKMIDMYDNQLDDLLTFRLGTERLVAETSTVDNIDQESTDTSLTKENDTPDGGNIDLTTDAFISRSMRNNLKTGMRERNILSDRDLSDNTISHDDARFLKALETIEEAVKNTRYNWLKFIERDLLTFDINDLI